MIKLIELNHTLTKVGAAALDLNSRTSPWRSRDLCQVLRGVLWMLAGEVEGVDTPTKREACRQLHIETQALLAEIELALQQPSGANQGGVRHRARVWNELVEHVRPTLGIRLPALQRRDPLPARPVAAGPAPRAGSFT